jgi:hypothetical protein
VPPPPSWPAGRSEIPGRKGRGRPDRLRNDDRTLPGRADQDAAAGALRFFREIVEHGGGADHFADRLDQRLALFLGEQTADLLGPLAQQAGSLVEYLPALFDIGRAPCRPGAPGRGQRLVEVGGAGKV